MATHTGSEGLIKIGSDTIGELRSYSLETTADTIEDSSMGDSARTYKTGLTSFTGTASVYMDEADTAQIALTVGGDAKAAAYLECEIAGKIFWGVGIDPSTTTAALKAVISSINRAVR